MNIINKTTRLHFRKSFLKTYRDTIKTKLGIQADVCGVWAVDRTIFWETTHTNGTINETQPIEILIRMLVGQNLLTLAGIQQEEKDIPVVYLAPFPSLIKVVGLERYINLIKEWPGRSMAMGNEVVRYKII